MGMTFNKVRNLGFGMIILTVFAISFFSIFNVNAITQSLYIISENEIPVLKTLEHTNNLLKEAAHAFEIYIRRERIEINDVLTPLDRLIRECRLLEDMTAKEESLIAKKLVKSVKLVQSSILDYVEQEKISPFGDTTELTKKSALKAQAETHTTFLDLSKVILGRAESPKVPFLEKIDLINNILSELVYSFEQYFHRERIEINDVLTPLDRLTDQFSLIERLVPNSERAMIKKMAHKTGYFRRFVLGYAEQETIDNSTSDTLAAIKENALKAQSESHNLVVEVTEVISARIDSSQKKMLSEARNIQKVVIAGMATAVAITLLLALFLGHALARPISRLVSGTEKLAQGEFNFESK